MLGMRYFLAFPILLQCLSAIGAQATYSTRHAFLIAKDQNQNIVQYDARVNERCEFDPDNPLEIYWLIFINDARYRRESLSFIERGIYGVDFQKRTPREIIGDIRVLKSRRVDLSFRLLLRLNDRSCTLRASVFGRKIAAETSFSRIELRNFSGQSPRELVIVGEKSASGEPETLTFNF